MRSSTALSVLLSAAAVASNNNGGFFIGNANTNIPSEPAKPLTPEEQAAREEAAARMREAEEHVRAINRAKRFARAQHNDKIERERKNSFIAAHHHVKGKAAKKAARKTAQQMREQLNAARTQATVEIENAEGIDLVKQTETA